jgi:hypothetical protein
MLYPAVAVVRNGFSSGKAAREKSDLSSDAARTAHAGPSLTRPFLVNFLIRVLSWM